MKIFLLLLLSLSAQAADYQDGDIIFHESQSSQSMAIREATDSRWSHVGVLFQNAGKWHVAEAAKGVTVVSLSSFIQRGKNREYRIYRLPGLTNAQKLGLREQFALYFKKGYDIYFEWSDDLIYCSELVYKIFLGATGAEIGRVQKFRELKLDGPYAKELIQRRLQHTGRELNLEEPVITPDSQIRDAKLELVEKFGP